MTPIYIPGSQVNFIPLLFRTMFWVDAMVQQVKMLMAKPQVPSSNLWSFTVEGETLFPHIVF